MKRIFTKSLSKNLSNKRLLILMAILLLASFLRLWQLGQVPHGLTVDEAAIGYNGYAVLTTRRDEWLEKLPISFRSFGDYKAPLAIYLNGLFTYFLGSTTFALRLPFALFGIVGILCFYLLTRELFWSHPRREALALIATSLMTLSPWHLHFSRLGFEAGMAMTLTVASVFFFYVHLRQKSIWLLLLSSILAVATLYTYHSNKLITPLLFAFLAWQNRQQLWYTRKAVLVAGAVALLLLAPFFYDAFWLNGLTRMQSSTVLTQESSLIDKIMTFTNNFLSYLHPDFLIFGQAGGNLRHSDGRFGVLSIVSFILLLILPLTYRWQRRERRRSGQHQTLQFALFWLFIALSPAALAIDPQHTVRSLSALPAFLLLATLSLSYLLNRPTGLSRVVLLSCVVTEIFTATAYLHNYYHDYAAQSADAFHSGYLEAFEYIKQTDKSQIQQVLFTNDYEHAYIHALFVFRLSPMAWQGGILNLFKFSEQINVADLEQPNTIVVASQFDDMEERRADHEILGSDGQAKFKIYHNRVE